MSENETMEFPLTRFTVPPCIQHMIPGIEQPYGTSQGNPPRPSRMRIQEPGSQAGSGQCSQHNIDTQEMKMPVEFHPVGSAFDELPQV
jgi:hypothetical protein